MDDPSATSSVSLPPVSSPSSSSIVFLTSTGELSSYEFVPAGPGPNSFLDLANPPPPPPPPSPPVSKKRDRSPSPEEKGRDYWTQLRQERNMTDNEHQKAPWDGRYLDDGDLYGLGEPCEAQLAQHRRAAEAAEKVQAKFVEEELERRSSEEKEIVAAAQKKSDRGPNKKPRKSQPKPPLQPILRGPDDITTATMSDSEETPIVAEADEVEVSGDAANNGQLSVLDALKGVLKLALMHDGLARGLREASKALDRRQAHMCVLNEACEEEAYKKLVVALCSEHKIPLIKVPDGKQLGEWAGLCVLDREGNARKVVNCSCVVVKDWGEESQERSVLLNYFQTEQ
ncbi:hypothetical protein BP6252_01512 [Coleophoma cylindrospora]|uniref:40S ribosomal protein S12 n=1 Tax=Coleophoma cylindrospora TaxID=1849047 RepID=A0A3D8ST40_9HELO|nr:hypothetical protein BP6252_01512 [Coleophoma cylindrospora]